MFKNVNAMFIVIFLSVSFLGIFPVQGMYENDINVGDITPVKNGMNKETAQKAICSFLKDEVLKLDNEIEKEDIQNIEYKGSIRQYKLFTLKDGTEWVQGTGGLERFLGALYLKKAIESHKDLRDKWCAVETKFILKDKNKPITIKIKSAVKDPLKNIFTIDSDDFFSVSRYMGDKKPEFYECNTSLLIQMTGYRDLAGCANLRVQGDIKGKITIIDTEYHSFENQHIVQAPAEDSQKELEDVTFTFSQEDL